MNEKKTLLVITTLIIGVLIGVVFGLFSVNPQVSSVMPVNIVQTSFMPITGAYVSVLRATGEREDLGWFHNVFTDAGKEALEQILANQVSYGNFSFIGLCNATAGCTAGAGDTTIDNEYTSDGLSRGAGTYGNLGNGNWSFYRTFTATANNLVTNMTGLLNQTSGGTLLAVVAFTDVTLQNNDQLLANYTLTAT